MSSASASVSRGHGGGSFVLRVSERSAFRPLGAAPAAGPPAPLSRSLSAQSASSTSPTKNALEPSAGSLLNELQRLQLDTPSQAGAAAPAVAAAGRTGAGAAGAGAGSAADAALAPFCLGASSGMADAASVAAAAAPVAPAPSTDPVTGVADPDGDGGEEYVDRSHKPLHRCTLDLLQLFRICNPNYSWTGNQQPRRVLTSPSVPSATNPNDNANNNLIMSVGDLLWHNTEDSHVFRSRLPPLPKAQRAVEGPAAQRCERVYRVLELLGEGTFGQVVKVEETLTMCPAQPPVSAQQPNVSSASRAKAKVYRAIKVIKNKPAYYNQALMEIQILRTLNEKFDPNNEHHLLRMVESFNCKGHLCLVFELLSVNLYELLKQNGYRGLSWSLLRMFLKQLLDSLSVLAVAKIIHCDLKPENILLNKLTAPDITLIDFGSACFEYQTVYSYIQSRFYRSPECLLSLPYTSTIDHWSFGAIAAELYLGLPLLPGITQHNQLARIIKFIGPPPVHMLEKGKNTRKFFHVNDAPTLRIHEAHPRFVFKTPEEYAADTRTEVGVHKVYFKGNNLKEVVDLYPMRKGINDQQRAQELEDRRSFLHFLQGFLRWEPSTRWSPRQALQHPFLQRQSLAGFDESAFERLKFVIDQPASIPPPMPTAGKAAASPTAAASATAASPASTPLSSVVAGATAVHATGAAGTSTGAGAHAQLAPAVTAVAPLVSPSKGGCSGIGSGVASAATAVGGHLLTNSELALRHTQQQQRQHQQQQSPQAGQPATSVAYSQAQLSPSLSTPRTSVSQQSSPSTQPGSFGGVPMSPQQQQQQLAAAYLQQQQQQQAHLQQQLAQSQQDAIAFVQQQRQQQQQQQQQQASRPVQIQSSSLQPRSGGMQTQMSQSYGSPPRQLYQSQQMSPSSRSAGYAHSAFAQGGQPTMQQQQQQQAFQHAQPYGTGYAQPGSAPSWSAVPTGSPQQQQQLAYQQQQRQSSGSQFQQSLPYQSQQQQHSPLQSVPPQLFMQQARQSWQPVQGASSADAGWTVQALFATQQAAQPK